MLQEPSKFLESLFNFDKDNIPDDVIKKIQPYMENEEFLPSAIAKVTFRNMKLDFFSKKAIANKRLQIKTENCSKYRKLNSCLQKQIRADFTRFKLQKFN